MNAPWPCKRLKRRPVPKPAPAPAKKVNPVKLVAAEARVAELEGKLVDVDARLAEPRTYADADLTARLGREREDLQQQLAKAEEAWSALYDEA